jgi:hypothetical protein
MLVSFIVALLKYSLQLGLIRVQVLVINVSSLWRRDPSPETEHNYMRTYYKIIP